jgi:hypothetical protein
MNRANVMQPLMANSQQLTSHCENVKFPQTQAYRLRKVQQLQQAQIQGCPQQLGQMPVQGQRSEEQMQQQILQQRNRLSQVQKQMGQMQSAPPRGSSSSTLPLAFIMGNPHMGNIAMTFDHPHTVQVSSNPSIPFDAQWSSSVQDNEQPDIEEGGEKEEASGRFTPAMEDTGMIPAFDAKDLMANDSNSQPEGNNDSSSPPAINASSQLVMEDAYTDDDWISSEDALGMGTQYPAQMIETMTIAVNGTPPIQNANLQQRQLRDFQHQLIDPSLLQLVNPEGIDHGHGHRQNAASISQRVVNGTQVHPSAQTHHFALSGTCHVPLSGRETPASSRSTPAPQAGSRRRAPSPTELAKVPCVNCYRNWWEQDCDEGSLCANCESEGRDCVRQRCFNFAAGTCPRGPSKCPNVHEGHERYHDDRFLVDQTKVGKRPARIGKSTDARIAPSAVQRA